MNQYRAAHISAEIEVQAYDERPVELYKSTARRTVKLSVNEIFEDDAGLDAAVASLARSILEAARR